MSKKKSDKDDLPSVENVTNTLTPVLWISRFFGLVVFEMPAGTPWPKFSAAYALSLCFAYGIMVWFGETFVSKKTDSIPITIFTYALIKYSNALVIVMSFVVGILNHKVTINMRLLISLYVSSTT